MEDPAPAIPLETLVAHREWVRRVARALVRDDALAEDLEQEVWLEAVQRPPRLGRGLGGWLAAALKHNLMDRRRAESRRRSREEATARREPVGSAADLVIEAETHRRLVSTVLDLDEPYRGTILLRYFEDLPLREIARRQGAPLETVRTRLRRAVERLRARFDRESGGDGRAWALALLSPFGGAGQGPARIGPRVAVAATVGGGIMAKKAVAVLTVAVLLFGGGGAWLLLSSSDGGWAGIGLPRSTAGSPLRESASAKRGLPEVPSGEQGSESTEGGPEEVHEVEFRGVVRGPDGKAAIPSALVEVILGDGARMHLVSDAEGRFSGHAKGPMKPGVAWAWAPGIGLGRAAFGGSTAQVVELDIGVAAMRPQAIEVKFGSISALRGALVEARLAGENSPRSPGLLASRRCDMEGRCTLTLPPDVPIRLVAHWPSGPREKEVVLESAPGPDETVSIVFEPRSPDGRGRIRGTVVDPEGRPLEGLNLMGLGQWSPSMGITGVGASTDSSGSFRFEEGWEGEWWVKLRPNAAGDWIHASYPTGRTGEDMRLRAVRCGCVQLRAMPAEGLSPGSTVGQATLYILRFLPKGDAVPDDSWASQGLGVFKEEGVLLPPGTWKFLLFVPGRVRQALKEVEVESGVTTDLGEIPLAVGARLGGRVSDLQGQPVRAGLHFVPVSQDGSPRPTERVGIYGKADGSFLSDSDLPPGPGWLLARGDGFATAARYITGLPPGGTAEAGEIRLARGGCVVLRGGTGQETVRVARTDGVPCTEGIPASPWVVGLEAMDRMVSLDADGGCIMEHVPPGEFEVRTGRSVRRFTVKDEETTVVDLAGSR